MDEYFSTPNELIIKTEKTSISMLPEKSRYIYEQTYKCFTDWKKKNNTTTSEDVLLAYMSNLSERYQPSTLWSQYSMLKALIKENEDIDIESFPKLKNFIKAKNKNYVKKKSNTFTAKEIEKFLLEAPDHKYLATKVSNFNKLNNRYLRVREQSSILVIAT